MGMSVNFGQDNPIFAWSHLGSRDLAVACRVTILPVKLQGKPKTRLGCRFSIKKQGMTGLKSHSLF